MVNTLKAPIFNKNIYHALNSSLDFLMLPDCVLSLPNFRGASASQSWQVKNIFLRKKREQGYGLLIPLALVPHLPVFQADSTPIERFWFISSLRINSYLPFCSIHLYRSPYVGQNSLGWHQFCASIQERDTATTSIQENRRVRFLYGMLVYCVWIQHSYSMCRHVLSLAPMLHGACIVRYVAA